MQKISLILSMALLHLLVEVDSSPIQIYETEPHLGWGHDLDLIQWQYGGRRDHYSGQEPMTWPLFPPTFIQKIRRFPQPKPISPSTSSTTSISTPGNVWTSTPTTETELEPTTTENVFEKSTVNIGDTNNINEMPSLHLREKRNRHKIRHTFMRNRYANSYK